MANAGTAEEEITLEIKGEPKSGTTFLAMSVMVSAQEVVGTGNLVEESENHVKYTGQLDHQSNNSAVVPHVYYLTQTSKHNLADMYRFKGADCKFQLKTEWITGPDVGVERTLVMVAATGGRGCSCVIDSLVHDHDVWSPAVLLIAS